MKKLLYIFIFLLCLPMMASAATYDVGVGGDYTTIAQVNAVDFADANGPHVSVLAVGNSWFDNIGSYDCDFADMNEEETSSNTRVYLMVFDNQSGDPS